MKLSGSQTEKLFEALLDAYRDYDKLKIMVKFKLGENLERFGGRGDLETVVFNLIQSAEARGKLERLIIGAYEKNPDNPELKYFYETVFQNFKQRAILDPEIIPTQDFGPNIEWRGKTDEIELQSFFKRKPDWYDVGFLQRIIEQAKSVCRVELPSSKVTATGVLIASQYVLTNYHVLKLGDNDDLEVNARNINLNFGCFSLDEGKEKASQSFRLNSQQPIIHSSPIEKLDYVLLQLEENFAQVLNQEDPKIQIAQWDSNTKLSETDGINILQHPRGDSMKLSITYDGITGVYPNSGLVQYINKTAGGSSGSPCFNDQGELVALHHAQRSKFFGTIREGILFSSIYADLANNTIGLN